MAADRFWMAHAVVAGVSGRCSLAPREVTTLGVLTLVCRLIISRLIVFLQPKHHAVLAKARQQDVPTGGLNACFEVLSLAAAIDQDCASRLGSHGLSEARFVLICILEGRGEAAAPHVLAEQLGVSRATVTGLLDGLERDGLVRRAPDPQDRRSLQVWLTPRGEAAARAVFVEHAAWIDALFADIDPGERESLARLLHKIWLRTDAGRRAERLSNSNVEDPD